MLLTMTQQPAVNPLPPASAPTGQQYPGQPYPAQPHPGQAYPGQPQPNQSQPSQPQSGQPQWDQPQWGQTYPGQPQQGQPYPDQPQPGQSYPGESYPAYQGQSYPGQAHPGQAYPGQAYPGQAYPGQAQFGQGLPVPYPGQPFPVMPGPGYVPVPPPSAQWTPERIDAIPGTGFGLVQLQVPPITSGLATGSLIAGIASILISVLVLCFGVAGAQAGWGGWVSGAFALLSVLFGAGAIALGLIARRQIRGSGRPGAVRFSGGGVAVAGIACGSSGAGIAVLCLVLSLVLQA